MRCTALRLAICVLTGSFAYAWSLVAIRWGHLHVISTLKYSKIVLFKKIPTLFDSLIRATFRIYLVKIPRKWFFEKFQVQWLTKYYNIIEKSIFHTQKKTLEKVSDRSSYRIIPKSVSKPIRKKFSIPFVETRWIINPNQSETSKS